MPPSKLACSSLFLGAIALAGCPPAPADCPDTEGEPGPPAWETLLDENDLDGAVLSVWGAAPDDVFIAGGPLGNTGPSAIARRYQGCGWKDLSPGGPETFWWVSGSSATDVWFVGEKGRISHFDGQAMSAVPSGISATIWGVFAFGPDDAWAVAGTPNAGTSEPNDIVLRWDGSSWEQEALPGKPRGVTLFKVWGTSSDDLFVVGEQGTLWHRDASGWTLETSDPPLTQSRLFTVHGCGKDDVYAVGGQSVLHRDANGWSTVDIALGNQVNGVSCGPPGSAIVVGTAGLKQRLVDGAWVDDFTLEPYADLHGAWADGEGAFWAVGGEFVAPPQSGPRKGIVARYGPTGVVRSP